MKLIDYIFTNDRVSCRINKRIKIVVRQKKRKNDNTTICECSVSINLLQFSGKVASAEKICQNEERQHKFINRSIIYVGNKEGCEPHKRIEDGAIAKQPSTYYYHKTAPPDCP